jgi:ubiquinone/menaquinone biosynthesis C-methylase UbiE
MNTAPPPSPLAGPRIWNQAAPDYLRDVAPGLALFAADALRLAGVGAGMRVADVACGPGALSFAAAAAGAHASALDFSAEMIGLLRERADREGITAVDARVGDGMALPWPDAAFDAVFSMFGLIFFPDRAKGLAELRRVLQPGGRAVVSSWVPAERVPVIGEIWEVLAAELPGLPYTRARPPLGDPDTIRAEMTAAGLRAVEVHELQHQLDVPSVLEYWRSLERSTPPLIAARGSVPDTRWAELSASIARRLEARFGSEPLRVSLMAFLGVGARTQ